MSSKSNFIPLYRIVHFQLNGLIADLSDMEVMEYVSDGKLLTIPLVKTGDGNKPMPLIELEGDEALLRVSLTYGGLAEIKHLRNILQPSQGDVQKEFLEAIHELKTTFETRLYKRSFKGSDFVFVKKYVAAKLDLELLKMLIDESEAIGMGGRKTIDGGSVYDPPATPKLHLLFTQVKPGDAELGEALREMKRVVSCVAGIKTQREIIHTKISKPIEQANNYRGFTVLLNEARGLNLISAEERRSLDKRWRDIPDERGVIEEDLKRRLDNAKAMK